MEILLASLVLVAMAVMLTAAIIRRALRERRGEDLRARLAPYDRARLVAARRQEKALSER